MFAQLTWMAPTSLVRTTALRLHASILSHPPPLSCRHMISRVSLPVRSYPHRIIGCRAFHASLPKQLHTSHVLRVRNYYSNGGRGGSPIRGLGLFGRMWAFVDRIPGKALVYGIIALDVGIWWIYQIAQGVSQCYLSQLKATDGWFYSPTPLMSDSGYATI